MKTELIDVSPTRKEIKIEIEPAQVRSAYDRVSAQYSKAANVPGFRPGHAPTSVVRTRYKSEIRARCCANYFRKQSTAPSSNTHSRRSASLNVQLDNTEALERFGEEPLTIKVGVEVLPEIKLERL